MKKIVLLAIPLVLALLLLGCVPKEKVEAPKVFIGGTTGLTISFIEHAPPEEVYDKDFPFTISVKVENSGEWDVQPENFKLEIIGFDPADFGKSAEELTATTPFPLAGKKLGPGGTVIPGTLVTIDFPDLQYAKEVIGKAIFPIRAVACYDYGTRASSNICILKNLLRPDTAICNPNEQKRVDNSGAPIHIASLRQFVVGEDKIAITFDIVHLGTGTIYKKGSGCADLANINKVEVDVDTGLDGLSCTGLEGAQGTVTLINGRKTIMCTQQLPPDRSDFEKPITITLQYAYEQFISKAIAVKHVGS